jgi:hypothetical protein
MAGDISEAAWLIAGLMETMEGRILEENYC